MLPGSCSVCPRWSLLRCTCSGFWLPTRHGGRGRRCGRATTGLILVTGAAVALVLFLATLPAHALVIGRRSAWLPSGAAGALMAVALHHLARGDGLARAGNRAPAHGDHGAVGCSHGRSSWLAVLLFPASIIDALWAWPSEVLTAHWHAWDMPSTRKQPRKIDGATLRVGHPGHARRGAFSASTTRPAGAARIVPLRLGAAMILAVAAAAGLFGAARTPAPSPAGVLSALVLALLSAVMLRWVPERGRCRGLAGHRHGVPEHTPGSYPSPWEGRHGRERRYRG